MENDFFLSLNSGPGLWQGPGLGIRPGLGHGLRLILEQCCVGIVGIKVGTCSVNIIQ